MKSPARLIAEKITLIPVDAGFRWMLATNIFIGKEPEKPDFCATTFDTGGIEQNAKLNDEMSTVQIRLRSPSYETGYERLQKIRLALEGISSYSNGADLIQGIWVQAPVTFIGRDKSNHPLFTLNLRILYTPADAGNRQNY